MASKKKEGIPKSVVSRCTGYLTLLQSLSDDGELWVSSGALAERLDLTSSTVRQDLSHISFVGRSKRGYEVEGLRDEIAKVLGVHKTWNVVVLGAGNLGCALAQHQDFSERGFNICGIFDSDLKKVGNVVGSLRVQDFETIRTFVKEHGVTMGILAVPDSAAQKVADAIVSAGVLGILNFTSAHIVVPEGAVACVDARVVASLHELSHAVTDMIQ